MVTKILHNPPTYPLSYPWSIPSWLPPSYLFCSSHAGLLTLHQSYSSLQALFLRGSDLSCVELLCFLISAWIGPSNPSGLCSVKSTLITTFNISAAILTLPLIISLTVLLSLFSHTCPLFFVCLLCYNVSFAMAKELCLVSSTCICWMWMNE